MNGGLRSSDVGIHLQRRDIFNVCIYTFSYPDCKAVCVVEPCVNYYLLNIVSKATPRIRQLRLGTEAAVAR